MIQSKIPSALLWTLLWVALLLSTIFLRPLLPMDETRYFSVAWEMWLRQDWLVPHLNGETYSHKPPLLFWSMLVGWKVFGVVDWWPRLVAPTFGLGCLFLTSRLGARLWPEGNARVIAPLMLLGSLYWATYTTLTMFDLLVCLWTLVGIHGLLDVRDGRASRGWIIFAVAIGMGVLSKGPVILIFLLPAALFAPFWVPARMVWIKWYVGFFLSLTGGVLIALAWAIPAGTSGGEGYRNAIFWGQSAGRIVDSFAHSRPFWWFAAILPVLILPWLIWPTLLRQIWSGIKNGRIFVAAIKSDSGLVLLTIWAGISFLVLSSFSGKQPHYLLPLFPALALGAALALERLPENRLIRARRDIAPAAALAFLLGIVMLVSPEVGELFELTFWDGGETRILGLLVVLVATYFIFRPPESVVSRISTICIVSTIIVASAHVVAKPVFDHAYDLETLAKRVADYQAAGYLVANYGKYHGQFNYLGKLTKPVAESGDGEIRRQLAANPRLKVIAYYEKLEGSSKPDFTKDFRSKIIAVWDRATLLPHPEIASRNTNGKRNGE
jgi:4-amino-4-deoxy-L-arabinose transferase-like glycosyltransferase